MPKAEAGTGPEVPKAEGAAGAVVPAADDEGGTAVERAAAAPRECAPWWHAAEMPAVSVLSDRPPVVDWG